MTPPPTRRLGRPRRRRAPRRSTCPPGKAPFARMPRPCSRMRRNSACRALTALARRLGDNSAHRPVQDAVDSELPKEAVVEQRHLGPVHSVPPAWTHGEGGSALPVTRWRTYRDQRRHTGHQRRRVGDGPRSHRRPGAMRDHRGTRTAPAAGERHTRRRAADGRRRPTVPGRPGNGDHYLGAALHKVLAAADVLSTEGLPVTVLDPRRLRPLGDESSRGPSRPAAGC